MRACVRATLEEALEYDLEYVRTGNLKVAFTTKAADDLEKQTDWEHKHGLAEVHMVTAKSARNWCRNLPSCGSREVVPTDVWQTRCG